MSAISAPPRPTSSRRPLLRLVPNAGARDSGATGALPGPAPRLSSRAGRHLHLVTSAAMSATTTGSTGGARTIADAPRVGAPAQDRLRPPSPHTPREGAPHPDRAPIPSPSTPSSPTAASPASTASPLTPAGGAAPAHGAEPPRRPGAPLPLRSRAPRQGSRPGSAGRRSALQERVGQGGSGPASRPGRQRRAGAPTRGEESRTATVVSRTARLAPNHPAVRSAGLRSQQGAAAVARGGRTVRAVPAPVQRRPVRSPAPQALPLPVRRFITALGACLMAIVLISSGLALSGLVGTEPTRTTTTVVQPGQSLWEVASATGSPDVAQTVATIVELNDLDSSTIHAGETLTIPVH